MDDTSSLSNARAELDGNKIGNEYFPVVLLIIGWVAGPSTGTILSSQFVLSPYLAELAGRSIAILACIVAIVVWMIRCRRFYLRDLFYWILTGIAMIAFATISNWISTRIDAAFGQILGSLIALILYALLLFGILYLYNRRRTMSCTEAPNADTPNGNDIGGAR